MDTFSDYKLTISGQFDLQQSWSPELSISDIALRSKTNGNNIKVDNFHVQLQIPPLLEGIILINKLHISGISLDLKTATEEQSANFLRIIKYLPVLIVESSLLRFLMGLGGSK